MTDNELKVILSEGEGYRIEFKETASGGLDKELVAFANASGGSIFLGITDDRKLKSITINNTLKTQVQDIANNCDPSIPVKFERFNNVLIVHVAEGKDKPYKCSNGFYLRVGPISQKLRRDEIVAFIKSEGKIRFDELECKNFNFNKHFSKKKFDDFLALTGIRRLLSYSGMLVNLSGANITGKSLSVNNTGALFFSKNLSDIYQHTAVTCVLYRGIDRVEVDDRQDYNDDIISSIERAMSFLKKYLSVRYEMTGGTRRREVPEIPYDALREALVNAVAHRDYFERGANVKVELFSDRVEISNPGGLVKGLSPRDFGTKSILRNPTLSALLQRAKYVEKLGTGIAKMRSLLRNAKLPLPRFSFDSFFTVIFTRKVRKVPVLIAIPNVVRETVQKAVRDGVLDAIDDAVLDAVDDAVGDAVDDAVKQRLVVGYLYIYQRKSCTLAEWCTIFNVSRPTAQRDIGALKSVKLVIFKGSPRHGRYLLTKRGNDLFTRASRK